MPSERRDLMPAKGYRKRTAGWTREAMIAAAHVWFEAHGDSPTASDWNPSDCRSAARRSMARAAMWLSRAARFEAGTFPWTGSVYKEFGGWNAFLTAAELPIHHRAPERAAPATVGPDELATLAAEAIRLPDGFEKKAALLMLADLAFAWAEVLPDE